jgi:hypothetical protein
VRGAAAAVGQRGRKPDAGSSPARSANCSAPALSASDIAKKVGATPALVYNIKARMGGGGAKRGPGRPRSTGSGSSMDGLAGILDAVKGAERERSRLRAALERIQSILVDALM